MDKEVKMAKRNNDNESTSSINSYVCLPKGNLKIENSLTNCYVTAVRTSPQTATVATRDQFQQIQQLHNQNASHAFIRTNNNSSDNSRNRRNMGSAKIYMNVYKATECDKIVQIVDQQKLYLHNGSICGILPYTTSRKIASASTIVQVK